MKSLGECHKKLLFKCTHGVPNKFVCPAKPIKPKSTNGKSMN